MKKYIAYKGGRTEILNVRITPQLKVALMTYVEKAKRDNPNFSMADFVMESIERRCSGEGNSNTAAVS